MKRLDLRLQLLTVAFAFPLLFASCEDIGSNLDPIPGYEYEAVTPEAIAEALVHLHPDKEICEEVHSAVRKAVSLGLDESYYFSEALGKDSRITDINRSLQSKLNSLPTGNSIKEIFAKVVEDDDYMLHYQIYWPYSKDWDGNTMPTITFQTEAAVPQEENVGYRIVKDRIEEVTVNEEYAKKNPVWIINHNPVPYELYPDFAVQNWTRTDRNEEDGVSERMTYYAQAYIQGSKKNPQVPDYVYDLKEIDFKQDTLSLYLKHITLDFRAESKPFFSGGLHYIFNIAVDDEDEPDMSEIKELSNQEVSRKLKAELVSIRFTLLRSDIWSEVVVSLHSLLSWQWLNYEVFSEYGLYQEVPKTPDNYYPEESPSGKSIAYGVPYTNWWGYWGTYRITAGMRLISSRTIVRETLGELGNIPDDHSPLYPYPICKFGVTKGKTTPPWHTSAAK